MMTNMISGVANDDADLVNASLSGNRDAFGQIVSRYQRLICSLTYAATGNLGQSEDLAQETFITAWKNLGFLRERSKLRSWLCGIARNRVNNFLRREGREPVGQAVPLEDVAESHAPEPLPVDRAITREEESILWQSLGRIPETYREPLVLFYRENRSVAAVAEHLELTEDTVKQRLSRGRKMLQEQVIAFVEGALERSNPSGGFAPSVMAALPVVASASKVGVLGAAGAKSAAAKGAGLGVLAALVSPLLIVFGNYASYRMSVDTAHTSEERGRIKTAFQTALFSTLLLTAVLAVPLYFACRGPEFSELFWPLLFSVAIVVYFLILLAFVLGGMAGRRRYMASILAEKHAGQFPPPAFEYRSRWGLFGWPLVHIRIGDPFDILRGPVKAWFAVGGSHAVGLIFAWGGLTVAPISFGGVAIGLLPFGAIALGLFPIGALAIGGWAYGGLAAGWQVFCGCGLGWNAVCGGIGLAHDYAVGEVMRAVQANTAAANEFVNQAWFFRICNVIVKHGALLMLAWVLPMVLKGRIIARARRKREAAGSNPSEVRA
jgi:RNA polymerase sigma factor (sigma-70 family)